MLEIKDLHVKVDGDKEILKGINLTVRPGELHAIMGRNGSGKSTLANVIAGLQAGINTFDGAIAGVGGCPYAPGAAGNAATEDLVHVLEAMGHRTGIDREAACRAGEYLAHTLGRDLPGRMHRVHMGRKAVDGQSVSA